MKKDVKKHMLKMLKKNMKDMMIEDKSEHIKDIMPKSEKMTKVTVMGDSPESVEKGLTKAQEIMKAKLGEASEGSEEIEKKRKKSKQED